VTGLQLNEKSCIFACVSSKAQAVIEDFKNLPQVEQLAVYAAIARTVTPSHYDPLSDEDLTAIAGESFALLDQEEDRAEPR
jgi:hypothetical protein